MSDERTGRELAPREEETGVSGRETSRRFPQGSQLSVERFSAGPRMHSVGLTEERSAQVVRQSGNARNIGFLAVLIVSIFIPIYWFYDIGVPALGVGSRQAADVAAQQVTDVSQGYALFLANCARCHGPNGQGGIGPPLNDQNKLYNAVTADGLAGKGHLNPTYITTRAHRRRALCLRRSQQPDAGLGAAGRPAELPPDRGAGGVADRQQGRHVRVPARNQ